MAEATTEKDSGAELEILNAKTESGTEDAVDGVTQEPDQLSLVSRIRKTIVKYIKLLQIMIFGAVFLIIVFISLFNLLVPKEKAIPEEKTNNLMEFMKKQGLANLSPILDGTNSTISD